MQRLFFFRAAPLQAGRSGIFRAVEQPIAANRVALQHAAQYIAWLGGKVGSGKQVTHQKHAQRRLVAIVHHIGHAGALCSIPHPHRSINNPPLAPLAPRLGNLLTAISRRLRRNFRQHGSLRLSHHCGKRFNRSRLNLSPIGQSLRRNFGQFVFGVHGGWKIGFGKRERLPEKRPPAKQQAGVEGICRQSVAGIGTGTKMPHQKGYLKRRFAVSGSLLTALKAECLGGSCRLG